MEREHIRYALTLEMLERHGALGDDAAIELLRSEFALAQNAGRFDALSVDDFEVEVTSRSTPQEGVTRYGVELTLEERYVGLDDDHQASVLVRRAFTDALNASYFLRICTDDDIAVEFVSRRPVAETEPLRSAA